MFHTILDSEIKHLNSTGHYIYKRQAKTLGTWLVRYYGTSSTVLLHALVCIVGALRNGSEHRWL